MSVQRQDLLQGTATADAATESLRAELRDVSFGYREDQPIFSGFFLADHARRCLGGDRPPQAAASQRCSICSRGCASPS